jgi:ATP-dependent RNA helicase RhlE
MRGAHLHSGAKPLIYASPDALRGWRVRAPKVSAQDFGSRSFAAPVLRVPFEGTFPGGCSTSRFHNDTPSRPRFPAGAEESFSMSDFTTLGLAEIVQRAVADQGHTTPTKIQAAAIPVILEGRDVVAIAQTGTGKTAAFVLPLLTRLAAQRPAPISRHPHILVLAPTRELAAQIEDCVRQYGAHQRLRTAVVVGGVSPGPQIRALANGLDILVATPGRLLDHVGTGAVNLSRTHTIVLDEADQMLDLGFMPAIKRIMTLVPRDRQTILLSATMPKEIRGLAQNFLRDPAEIAVAPAAKPIERIDQRVMHLDHQAKRGALASVLRGPDMARAIVFTRTKRGADKVQKFLEVNGFAAAAIHGNKSQNQRERALDGFRDGHVKVLVATDIAARGIDVDGVSHVINFELPNVPEAYVHRIGRTARAGASGIAIAFCGPDERDFLRDIERLTGIRIPVVGAPEGVATIAAPASAEPERMPRGQAHRQPHGQHPNGQHPNGQHPHGHRPHRGGAKRRGRGGKPHGQMGHGRSQGGGDQRHSGAHSDFVRKLGG